MKHFLKTTLPAILIGLLLPGAAPTEAVRTGAWGSWPEAAAHSLAALPQRVTDALGLGDPLLFWLGLSFVLCLLVLVLEVTLNPPRTRTASATTLARKGRSRVEIARRTTLAQDVVRALLEPGENAFPAGRNKIPDPPSGSSEPLSIPPGGFEATA